MITNEQVYERAMRMGIEGRCVPHEAIWDLATKQLAEEDRRVDSKHIEHDGRPIRNNGRSC